MRLYYQLPLRYLCCWTLLPINQGPETGFGSLLSDVVSLGPNVIGVAEPILSSSSLLFPFLCILLGAEAVQWREDTVTNTVHRDSSFAIAIKSN